MRAALISWHEGRGVVVLSAGPNTFTMEPTSGNMQKDAEQYVKLERYLRALAPILPPDQPRKVEDEGLPEITDEELATAQRFTNPTPARGSGVKRRTVTREELHDIVMDLSYGEEEEGQ